MFDLINLKKTGTLAIGLTLALPTVAAQTQDEENNIDTITVTAHEATKTAGTNTEISESDIRRDGGTNFGSIMRYQPLISAPGNISGSGSGKSSWDRGGFTGYNIRGLDANRVSIDIDGMPLPIAQGRVNSVGRAGFGSYGIGRDYIDTYMYNKVDIQSGATSVSNANNALGGSVSFQTKTASYYLYPGKTSYFGFQNNYDSADRSYHQGITIAGGDEYLNGILVLSRRDGQQGRNYGDSINSYPENWHSNSILAGIGWQMTDEHLVNATIDFNSKTKNSHYDTWDRYGKKIESYDHQRSKNNRFNLAIKDQWKPTNISWIDSLTTQINYQRTNVFDDTYLRHSSKGNFNTQTNYNTKSYNFITTLLKSFDNQKITAGLNAKWSEDESPFYTSAKSQNGRIFPDGDYTKPQADSRSYQIGGFFEDRISFNINDSNNFYIVPGVRAIYQNTKPRNLENMAVSNINSSQLGKQYNSNSDFKILPSLAFMYDLNPNLTAYLQYKRGAQMPNQNQLYGSYLAHSQMYVLVGDSNLKTETSDNFELGLKGQPVSGMTLSSAVFYNKYKNFIAYSRYKKNFVGTGNRIVYQSENRDKAYIYGAELSSEFNFGSWFESVNGLSARFAIGYNQGKSKSSYLGDKYVEMDTIAPLKSTIGLAWDDPNKLYGVAVTATFQKGKKTESTTRETHSNDGTPIKDSTDEYFRIAGHGTVDLTGYVNITKNVKLSGGIYNLTDQKYWDYLSNNKLYRSSDHKYLDMFTAPGRTFQLGLDIDF
ncbi:MULTISPECIES: TonB-dependent receptor domain-containing protein [unclassified Gilliamella]|uniref:TonB-dependent receptor domain-containing protein n=1 Tax=unclassified Gilliamella TaxID=2685620 RepID=UPI001C698914|nr:MULTISPECIES: TonB-dependent receptor [unclassified Gilliamella]MCX8602230.1 TonB-dependent receptor [Gilliamella sp. B3722]MCX8607214.1 TonB-dependent receptor [Gilliamella sp. B3771]MCX8611500.1 TonB-dependent receptor [Gilliamella sp. B3891]MCX8613970.1 TonB-dependent receptor [Gilliamella sp. B3773]MCX8614946.1 TonB-dependent receptor [Gilliamella sp. B3770]